MHIACEKALIQEAYQYKEELEKTARLAGYDRSNNVKHGRMEDTIMNFTSETKARDAAFIKLTTTNRNLYKQLRQ